MEAGSNAVPLSTCFAKQVESGTAFDPASIVDQKCGTCGVKLSEVGKIVSGAVATALSLKFELSNFFKFYENRCPKGGFHEYSGDTCKKCGMVKGKTDAAKFAEYKTIYEKEREEMKAEVVEEVAAEDQTRKISPDVPKKYESWSPDFNAFLSLATIASVPVNAISALGATEKVEYSDILNEKFVPPDPKSSVDTRIYVIAAMVKLLITEYNNLRYFYTLAKPMPELAKLIDESGLEKAQIAGLDSLLPSIYDGFSESLDYFRDTGTPKVVLEFCLQSLVDRCLAIYNLKQHATTKLRQSFVVYFVGKIIKEDELQSLPGQVNWNVFKSPTGAEPTAERYDPNLDADAGIENKEDLAKEKEDEEFGTTDEPAKNKFDLDIDEDQDEEDFLEANDVKTEGYAFD